MLAEGAGALLFAALCEQVACIDEVCGHQARCELRIALLYGGEDGLVEGDRMLEVHQLRGHSDHVQHGAMDGVEETSGEAIA